jgi:hypothetical protein
LDIYSLIYDKIVPEIKIGKINHVDCGNGWSYSGQLMEFIQENGRQGFKRHGLGRLQHTDGKIYEGYF